MQKRYINKSVNCVKGNSAIHVSVGAIDKDGHRVLSPSDPVAGYCVFPGGRCGGIHYHESYGSALAEFSGRLTALFARGYTVEAQD